MSHIGIGVRGVALLEAVVALAIISIAGLSMLELVSSVQRDRARLDSNEQTLATADRVMTAVVLLTRQDLDRRLGRRPIGEFVVSVARPEPALYRLAIASALSPDAELLSTVVYRPGSSR